MTQKEELAKLKIQVARNQKVLHVLITWLQLELGEKNVTKLLELLQGELNGS